MKEQITKFDLTAAFKALDEVEYPETKGLKADRINLKETLHGKNKTDLLLEDYYDVNDQADLEAAQKDREAEVAQAKLARIEKIVDLDANSADELLGSYAGKVIIQCPQCMTMFYKDPEDLEVSEDNPEIVNVNETCQHCGNMSGYTVIGKVAPVDEKEAANYEAAEGEEVPTEEEGELGLNPEEPTEENEENEEGEETTAEETAAEEPAEDEDVDLNVEEEPEEETKGEEEEEEKKEESLHKSEAAISDNDTENHSDNLTLNEEAESLTEADKKRFGFFERDFQKADKIFDEYFIYGYSKQTDRKANSVKIVPENNKAYQFKSLEQARKYAKEASKLAAWQNGYVKVFGHYNSDIKDLLNESEDETFINRYANGKDDTPLANAAKNKTYIDVLVDNIKAKDAENEHEAKVGSVMKDMIPDAPSTEADSTATPAAELAKYAAAALGEADAIEKLTALDENTLNKYAEYLNTQDEDDLVIKGLIRRVKKALENKAAAKETSVEETPVEEAALKADEVAQAIRAKLRGQRLNLKTIDTAVEAVLKELNLAESINNSDNLTDNESEHESENLSLNEEELRYSEEAVDDMLENSKEFNTPISDNQVETMLDTEDTPVDALEDIDEVDDEALGECVGDSLKEVYENVSGFSVTNLRLNNGKFIVEGKIHFTSGSERATAYVFNEMKKAKDNSGCMLRGFNEELDASKTGEFKLYCKVNEGKMSPSKFAYRYNIENNLVEGLITK